MMEKLKVTVADMYDWMEKERVGIREETGLKCSRSLLVLHLYDRILDSMLHFHGKGLNGPGSMNTRLNRKSVL